MMTDLDRQNLAKVQNYAKLSDEAAEQARVSGDKRLANRCRKNAGEWRRVAAEILTSRDVTLIDGSN